MTIMHARLGDAVKFSKTVGEADVYGFAGITGDLSQNHVDEEFMSHSIYKHRIAHGALMVGYMSTASILEEIGYGAGDIAALESRGVIKTGGPMEPEAGTGETTL